MRHMKSNLIHALLISLGCISKLHPIGDDVVIDMSQIESQAEQQAQTREDVYRNAPEGSQKVLKALGKSNAHGELKTPTQPQLTAEPERVQAITAEEIQKLTDKIYGMLKDPTRPGLAQDIEALIEQGADVNTLNINRVISLIEQNPSLFEIFLEHGARVQGYTLEVLFDGIISGLRFGLTNNYSREVYKGDTNIFILMTEYGYSYNKIIKLIEEYPATFMRDFGDLLMIILLRSPQKEIQTFIDKEDDEAILIKALRVAVGQGQTDTVTSLLTRLQQLTIQRSITWPEYKNALLQISKTLAIIIHRARNAGDEKFAAAPRDVYIKILSLIWQDSLREVTVNALLPEDTGISLMQQEYPDFEHELVAAIVHQFYEEHAELSQQESARVDSAAQMIEGLFQEAIADVNTFNKESFQAQASLLSVQNLEDLRSRLESLRSASTLSSLERQRLDIVLPIVYDAVRRRSRTETIQQPLDKQLEQAVKDGDLSDVRDLLKKVKIISPTLLELAGRELALESNPRLQRISPELIEARRDILRLIQERMAPSVRGPHRATLSGESA